MDLTQGLKEWRDRLFGDAIPMTVPFLVLILLAVAVSLLIGVLVAYVIVRYRRRPGDGEPRQIHGNRTLEIMWTAIPALVLVALFGFLLFSMLTDPTAGTDLPSGRGPTSWLSATSGGESSTTRRPGWSRRTRCTSRPAAESSSS